MLHISSFSIEELNNFYNYKNCSIDDIESDLLILYGENGSGKTTILNLIFHLLSPKKGQGHMNAIARVPFKSIKVFLSDKTVISAVRENDNAGYPVIFRISKPKTKVIEYYFVPERYRDRYYSELLEQEITKYDQKLSNNKKSNVSFTKLINAKNYSSIHVDESAHHKYISAIDNLGITCYFMATDRRIRCDLIEEKRVSRRPNQEVESNRDDIISRVQTQYLKEALSSAMRYTNKQIIKASNTGSKNTYDIYSDLIKRISSEEATPENINIDNALDKLISLSKESNRFSELGLSPELEFHSIQTSIENSSSSNIPVLYKILLPYIDSLSARFSALQPIAIVIETFLSLLNDLFKHKTVNFSPTDGFMIYGPNGDSPLDTEQLSSGEQQLLLMFCYLLVSNDNHSIFMIDEPEISLNIKWQRQLIGAMRRITKGSKNQIIIATHSIELLSQYGDKVIELDPSISNEKNTLNDNSKENH